MCGIVGYVGKRDAKNILMDAIAALEISPSTSVIPKEYQWYDTKYYTVPNVVGKTVSDAKKELKLL